MKSKEKGNARLSSEAVRVYKDAVPKTGTRLTQKRISRHFRSLNRRGKQGAA